MEITPWMIYLLFQLDSLPGLFKALSGTSITIGFILMGVGAIIRDEGDYSYNGTDNRTYDVKWASGYTMQKRAFLLIIPAIFFGVCAVLTPSTKTALMIWTIPPIANNEQVQQLPIKLVDALNGYLDEYIAKE